MKSHFAATRAPKTLHFVPREAVPLSSSLQLMFVLEYDT